MTSAKRGKGQNKLVAKSSYVPKSTYSRERASRMNAQLQIFSD